MAAPDRAVLETAVEAPERALDELGREPAAHHRDFVEKVCGTLPYADDWGLPGMLHGVVVRARLPSARIVSIDVRAARAVEGVHAVMTAADVPYNGILDEASGLGVDAIVQPVLAEDRVRYDGEPVALVAAETPQAALEAAALVDVDYEELPGVFEPEQALRDDAPAVHPGGNRYVTWRSSIGDVDAAMRSADLVVEETYRTQRVDHAYLEPEAGIGWIDSDGVLTLRVSTQVIEHAREVAEILRLPHSRVRVIASYMGGGFGGKEDMTVEPFIALLVWRTRRPVRMVWTRQESLLARHKRHPFTMRYRTGVRRDGTIVAQDVRIIGDAGAYPLLSSRVLFAAAVNATGPYRVADARVESVAVFTNTVPTSAFRGFGAMQVVFGYESQMDRIAQLLELDPAEVRRRNFVARGDLRVTGEALDTGVGVEECMRRALAELGPRPRPSRPGTRVGRGFACSMQPYGRSVFFADRASAWIGLEHDGTMVIRAGVTDLGAGQAASLADIAGEVLGVTADRTTVHIGDSALTPLTGGTFATRQLYMSGNAVLKVARALRAKLEAVAAALLECDPEALEFSDNRVRAGGRSITIGELARAAEHQGVMPYVHDTFEAETGEFDRETGRGRSFPDYTYGAHAADVEVDELTGQVRILAYVACHDVGRAIDMRRVEGQIQGAAAQGIGYALSEQVELVDGVASSTLFAEYLIPVSVDLPDIRAIGLELHPGKGPLGARGIGEPPIGPCAPALAAAIEDAVGVRLVQLPMTPERVQRALADTRARDERAGA
ncbi:MAG TPA: xanthine dehydrogenase family protein molybdopterin-binding subunit [Solirubrobacteraceae bacterium]|nr:xanthine dehydrogenase family protein molybdopterin-binding subunit [Solirubrobacteraceae bacterium]